MGKEREKERNWKFLVGVACYCAEMKFLLTFLLLFCSVATLYQILPSQFAALDFRRCVANFSSSTSAAVAVAVPVAVPAPSPPLPYTAARAEESVSPAGVVKRVFNPYGAAAYLFVQMGAYRGGLNTFSIVGLGSKPLHSFGRPRFECRWVPSNASLPAAVANGTRFLTDWGYGRVYTVVVVNCTFPTPVGADGAGGKLFLSAVSGEDRRDGQDKVQIQALSEQPGALDAGIFTSKPKYDYLYCGSSLYGNLSPQRIREWMAYHVRLFGQRSHFVFHDAGGLHRDAMAVLQPWIEKGYVTVQDIKDQAKFDGYYYNQFLVVNDCLHRYKFMAKWIFFFDLDEFIFVPPKNTIHSVVASLSNYSQFTIEQMPMAAHLCSAADKGKTDRMWGIEKMVYRDAAKVSQRGDSRRDRKYAVQPRDVLATGVHMSQDVVGPTQHQTNRLIKYFHYHGSIAIRRDPCREFRNETRFNQGDSIYTLDRTLRGTAGAVKRFEQKTLGSRLQRTRQ